MKKLTIFVCLAVTLAISSTASAHDVVVPDWRYSSGSTYQKWEFDLDVYQPGPDDVNNPYGTPSLRVTSNGGWVTPGAWYLGEIDALIPNSDVSNPEKWIQIQLTWQPADNDPFLLGDPFVAVGPFDNMTMSRHDDDKSVPGWILSKYNITISPNPLEEWIAIKGDILVDQLVIDTICVPEPATICLFGLGMLTLLKKRRV